MTAPFTSPLAEALAPDLLERFCRYVSIDTQSHRDRTRSPSTPGQLELAAVLVEELLQIGLADAAVDEHGYVYATLAGARQDAPVIGLIAHLDTTPDAPGAGVSPIVHRDYDGGVIELPRAGVKLDPATMPELKGYVGHDLVTASGDTLLGGDDKAGVAAIMAAVRHLVANPQLPRPTIRVAFTPDEEIGEGATLFDLPRFGALCAYTVDGASLGELQDESFAALEAVVAIDGIEVHPGDASGKMVNALQLAAHGMAELAELAPTPDASAGREGFIHIYEMEGTTRRAELRAILRDFDEEKLAGHARLIEDTFRRVADGSRGGRVDVTIHRQYRNMRQYIAALPAAVEIAEEALRLEGITPSRDPIRGGTDGSRLSEMGLPTPNLFDGAHELHSVREWASLQEMAASAATIVRLAEVWARHAMPDAGAGAGA